MHLTEISFFSLMFLLPMVIPIARLFCLCAGQRLALEPIPVRFLASNLLRPVSHNPATLLYLLIYNHKYMFVYPIKLWFHQEVRDYDHGQNRPSRFNDDGPQQNQQGGGGGGNQQRNSFGGGQNRNWMNNDRRNNDDFQSKRRRF